MAVTYKKVVLSGAEFISGGSSTPYVQTFLPIDWVGPASGEYSITIPQTMHNKGATPTVQVYEVNGSDSDQVVAFIRLSDTGDVIIIVSETPDLRFEGKVLIG